jgi:hypothetical protein
MDDIPRWMAVSRARRVSQPLIGHGSSAGGLFPGGAFNRTEGTAGTAVTHQRGGDDPHNITAERARHDTNILVRRERVVADEQPGASVCGLHEGVPQDL